MSSKTKSAEARLRKAQNLKNYHQILRGLMSSLDAAMRIGDDALSVNISKDISYTMAKYKQNLPK